MEGVTYCIIPTLETTRPAPHSCYPQVLKAQPQKTQRPTSIAAINLHEVNGGIKHIVYELRSNRKACLLHSSALFVWTSFHAAPACIRMCCTISFSTFSCPRHSKFEYPRAVDTVDCLANVKHPFCLAKTTSASYRNQLNTLFSRFPCSYGLLFDTGLISESKCKSLMRVPKETCFLDYKYGYIHKIRHPSSHFFLT